MNGQYTVESNDGKIVVDFPSPTTWHLFVIMALVMLALMLPMLLHANVNASLKAAALVLLTLAGFVLHWIYQPREAQTVTMTDRSLRIQTGEEQQEIPLHYIDKVFVREMTDRQRWYLSAPKMQNAASLKDNPTPFGIVVEAASEETVLAGHLPIAEQHRICSLIQETLGESVAAS